MSNKKCLLTKALLIYVGKHLNYIRKNLGHSDFEKLGSDEYPKWWTSYWANFTKECDKFQMINGMGDDAEFGDLDIRPLYRVIENTSSDDPLSECGLLWFTNCMKDTKGGNTAIETAAWLFMTADSVARGGEVKFQVFKEWDYDHFLKVTNTGWTELKTCNFYAMTRVPDEK
jgi:hypothetical protein